jgi:hypothetical protein
MAQNDAKLDENGAKLDENGAKLAKNGAKMTEIGENAPIAEIVGLNSLNPSPGLYSWAGFAEMGGEKVGF